MNRFAAVVVLGCCVACGGMMANLKTERQADLRQRASFDLGCTADKLEITPLDDAARSHGGGTTGVRGCDKQATYVWDAYGTGWIMNNDGKGAPHR